MLLQPSEGKRQNPVHSCGLWVTVRACIWLWQARAAALGDSPGSELRISESDLLWQPDHLT